MKNLKIDMHTHILPEKLPDFSKKFGYGDFIHLHHRRPHFADMMKGDKFFREINENCWEPNVRVAEYAKFNTQYQVVCTIPVMFSYWAKSADCLELSRFLNDHIVQLVNDHPKHYLGLGTVPMQSADHAVQELQRLKEMGVRGIQIGSNINNVNLSDPSFDPIWKACEELEMAVMIHPWEMMGSQQMTKYWLPWLVGMPAETSRAACSLIFGGVMARYPKIRFNFSHAGGSFLPTLGRVEHGFNCRPDLVAIDNPINPRDYLGKFWVDCITHDLPFLKYIMEMVGSKKITLGSDYPFPLGDLEIGKFIEDSDISQEDQNNIMYQSTLDWLGMTTEDL